MHLAGAGACRSRRVVWESRCRKRAASMDRTFDSLPEYDPQDPIVPEYPQAMPYPYAPEGHPYPPGGPGYPPYDPGYLPPYSVYPPPPPQYPSYPPAGSAYPPFFPPEAPIQPHRRPGYQDPWSIRRPEPPAPPRRNAWLVGIAVAVVVVLVGGLVFAIRAIPDRRGREPATQELIDSIADQVASVRGLTWRSAVAWRVVTPDELRKLIREQNSKASEQERAELDAISRLLKALRLVAPDTELKPLLDKIYEDEVLGFYDIEKKELVLRSDGDGVGPLEKVALAHELAHALVDQNFDLGELQRKVEELDDSERSAAFDALLEGDASVVMIEWAWRYLGSDEISQIESEAVETGEVLDSAPRVIRRWIEFPYEHGTEFVMTLKSSEGWEGVDAAYEDPPSSTRDILHPDKYMTRGRSVGVAGTGKTGEVEPPLRTPGCETLLEGVVGELDTWTILEEFLDASRAREAAEGWRSDKFRFEDCGGKHVLRVDYLTESPKEADELRNAWSNWIEGWSSREGNYPHPESFSPELGGGRVSGTASRVSVILADDLSVLERKAA